MKERIGGNLQSPRTLLLWALPDVSIFLNVLSSFVFLFFVLVLGILVVQLKLILFPLLAKATFQILNFYWNYSKIVIIIFPN